MEPRKKGSAHRQEKSEMARSIWANVRLTSMQRSSV